MATEETTTNSDSGRTLDRQTLDMVDEAVEDLNYREYDAALKTFRRIFDVRNVWKCVKCGHESDSYHPHTGCEQCGAEMVVWVRQGAANERRGSLEAPE